jgi:hypothetical protein
MDARSVFEIEDTELISVRSVEPSNIVSSNNNPNNTVISNNNPGDRISPTDNPNYIMKTITDPVDIVTSNSSHINSTPSNNHPSDNLNNSIISNSESSIPDETGSSSILPISSTPIDGIISSNSLDNNIVSVTNSQNNDNASNSFPSNNMFTNTGYNSSNLTYNKPEAAVQDNQVNELNSDVNNSNHDKYVQNDDDTENFITNAERSNSSFNTVQSENESSTYIESLSSNNSNKISIDDAIKSIENSSASGFLNNSVRIENHNSFTQSANHLGKSNNSVDTGPGLNNKELFKEVSLTAPEEQNYTAKDENEVKKESNTKGNKEADTDDTIVANTESNDEVNNDISSKDMNEAKQYNLAVGGKGTPARAGVGERQQVMQSRAVYMRFYLALISNFIL